MDKKTNVFIIGARGYTKKYGGWEALVHGLLDNWSDQSVHFYVFEITNNPGEEKTIEINPHITCIIRYIKQTGNSAMVIFDYQCTNYAYNYVKKNNIECPIFYYLGSRVGPYIYLIKGILHRAGITILENPAGLEWKRAKWKKVVQLYVKTAAYMMANATDYLICDSKEIQKIYKSIVKNKKTKSLYIAYGCYNLPVVNKTKKTEEFCSQWDIKAGNYYLIVGRFIPENNYEMMLKGFIESSSMHDLVVICNYKTENQDFLNEIKALTKFESNPRIKMVGTVYDTDVLNWLRQNAVAYIHGHSVGGTNPGLLEAMSATDINLLNGVPFNREVGEDAALYFNNEHELAELINKVDMMDENQKRAIGKKAKDRMQSAYSWEFIVEEYRKLFECIRN